jgi:hypothetical protein
MPFRYQKVTKGDWKYFKPYLNEWVHYKTHTFPIVNILFSLCDDFVCFE